jgi:hypothetical protein
MSGAQFPYSSAPLRTVKEVWRDLIKYRGGILLTGFRFNLDFFLRRKRYVFEVTGWSG